MIKNRECKQRIARVPDISHDEWLEYRRSGIGGSDAATIAGLNEYSSLYYLYNDKLGLLAPKEDNEAMRLGRDMEAYVAARWSEATGKKVQRSNYMWRSTVYPWMIADIDREVVGENSGLECKTTSPYAKADLAGGEIPLNYYCQCQHYMAVMGYERMYLAVLQFGNGFYHFVIERDEAEIAALAEAEKNFWINHVQALNPPEIDGSDATVSAIKQLHPDSTEGSTAILKDEVAEWIDRAIQIDADIASMEKEQKSLKAKVMAAMGDAETGEIGTYKISYKTTKSSRINAAKAKTFIVERGANLDDYMTVSVSRPLKYTVKKEKSK